MPPLPQRAKVQVTVKIFPPKRHASDITPGHDKPPLWAAIRSLSLMLMPPP